MNYVTRFFALLFAALLVGSVVGGLSAIAQSTDRQTKQPEDRTVKPVESANQLREQTDEVNRLQKGKTASRVAFSSFRQNSAPNLVMRSGADLAGVSNGSTSIADVDGDGNQDLLITGFLQGGSGRSATLYLGGGDKTFSEAEADLTGIARSSTSIADVDGDGNQDLLITGEDSDSDPLTALYMGNGDGSFSETDADLGESSGSSSIADFDGDGNADLLIAGINGQILLYLGNGDGTFSEADADLGQSYHSISIADVDEDGNQDILITSGDTRLYLGNGDATFTRADAGLIDMDRGSSSSSAADVNGDGNQDLLITGQEEESNTVVSKLYLGNGNGDFAESGTDLKGVLRGSTSIGDVDGDGNKDVLITGITNLGFNSEVVTTLYLGNGDNTFSKVDTGLTATDRGSTSIADVDGDGDQDLLITGIDSFFGSSSRLYVNRENQPSSNRAPRLVQTFDRESLPVGVTLSRFVEAGDPDGDTLSIQHSGNLPGVSVNDRGNGIAEISFTPSESQGGDVVDVMIEASDPSGATQSFSFSVEIPSVVAALPAGLTGTFRSSSSIGDVDGDGNQDLLITGFDSSIDPITTLYLGNGDGTFSKEGANLTRISKGSASIADVNGDDNQDLLIAGRDFSNDPRTVLYLGNGDGTFSEAVNNLVWVSGGSTSIADVNDDGNQDLLITGVDADDSPVTKMYLGNGDGTFSEAEADLTAVEGGSTSIADVNGDGDQDLLITGDSDPSFGKNRTATLYLGNGQGEFNEAGAGLTGVILGSTSIADIDGDQNRDLLITGSDASSDRTTTLYLGDGQGGSTEADAGLVPVSGGSTSIADVDGDGDQDLLTTGTAEGLRGTGSFPVSILYENLYDSPLPVDLAGFDVISDENRVRLTWQTASEQNNAGFEVQRKEESGWAQIGYVESKAEGGTTTEAQSYQFAAENLSVGTHQFRLKQVDLDGSSRVHSPLEVDVQMQEALQLTSPAPNPVSSSATLSFAVKKQTEATVAVYDLLGRKAATLFEGRPTPGESMRLQLDASELSSGQYIIRLRADGRTETQRMTVVR